MVKRKIWLEANEIPYDIFENVELKVLSLTINEFDFWSHEVLKPGYLKKLTKLKKLDLTGIWVSDEIFCNEICSLLQLEDLTLMYSDIQRIPEEISNLKKLNKICFRANKIKELPSTFFTLPRLKEINFINNRFDRIPKELFEIKTLEEISFMGNLINSKSIK